MCDVTGVSRCRATWCLLWEGSGDWACLLPMPCALGQTLCFPLEGWFSCLSSEVLEVNLDMNSKGPPALQCCFQAVSSSSEAQKLSGCPFLVLGKNAHVVLGSLLSGDSCHSNQGLCWDVCRLTSTAFSLKPKQRSASLPGRFLLALHLPAPSAPCCHFSGPVHLCLI